MWRLARSDSEALGIVEDLQPGSSPTTASAPPVRGTPTKLPWRSESAARSRPGALPYHMASTPSYFEPGSWPASWLPQAEVAPSSSFRPGTWRTWWPSTSSRLRAELLVEAAERRALVAGDHRAGHEAAAAVGAVLVEREPDEALEAGEEDASLLEDVLVVERDVAERPRAAASVVAGAPEATAENPARDVAPRRTVIDIG